ncbi:ninein-like [Oncorhynchus nerka]|uniref:ninein-like n=1 Tax=Oncorhynchus nerka TaxID=8023 RepID=UPI0031B83DE7
MAVCMTALEAELTNAVEGTVLLEEGKAQLVLQLNTLRDKVAKMGAVECRLSSLLQERKALEKQTQGLRNQLAKSQERNQVLEESLQSDLQSARLKSDLRVSQQEKDALKQEVMSLHKQLQSGNDKNQVLEMALHSSGYQSQQKKLYQDELARLVEQEQQQLRQENERLTMELHHTREKLEAAILTVKQQRQQGQSSVGKTVEQEKTALKRELDVMHQELLSAQNKVCEVQRELDSLRQENEGLKTQQAPLQAWLQEVSSLPAFPNFSLTCTLDFSLPVKHLSSFFKCHLSPSSLLFCNLLYLKKKKKKEVFVTPMIFQKHYKSLQSTGASCPNPPVPSLTQPLSTCPL